MNARPLAIVGRVVLNVALLAVILFGAPQSASAASIIYVKVGGAGAHTGTSWSNAYPSLQVALTAATSGQQIWVAKGTYYPTSTTDRTKSFHLKNGVAVLGGFAGGETLARQRRPATNITILSGNIGAAGLAGNSFHVVTGSGTNATAVLDGFTILDGNADAAAPNDSGAGMLNEAGSPTVRGVVFDGNVALTSGGGMYNHNGSHPALLRVLFTGNKAAHGAGMANALNSAPSLQRVRFAGNHASVAGGGMDNNASSPTLAQVVFTGNTGATMGGGMANFASSSPTVVASAFTGNTGNQGAGLYSENGSAPAITNVTFAGNHGVTGGAVYNNNANTVLLNVTIANNQATTAGGIYDLNSSPQVNDVIIWGNGAAPMVESGSSASIKDTILQQPTCPTGTTCTHVLNQNPVLGALANHGGFTRNMSLRAGSAAIDAGGQNTTCAPRDQRGVIRPQGAACDIGAYEVRAETFASVGLYDGTVRESTATSEVGTAPGSTGLVFRVGDDAQKRQFRGFVHFNTTGIPDGASIVLAKVLLKSQGITGVDPFTTHAPLLVDVKKPYFGTSINLEALDFQAPATVTGGTVGATPILSWYTGFLNASGRSAINKLGTTQFRLRFKIEDDGDAVADYISFSSGDAAAPDRPRLVVYYNP